MLCINSDTGEIIKTLDLKNTPFKVDQCMRARHVAVATTKDVVVYDMSTFEPIATINMPESLGLCYSANGQFMAATSSETVRLYQTTEFYRSWIEKTLPEAIRVATFSLNSMYVVLGLMGGVIEVRSTLKLDLSYRFTGHEESDVNCILSVGFNFFMSGGDDCYLRFWVSEKPGALVRLSSFEDAVLALALSFDMMTVACGGKDGRFYIFNSQTRVILRSFKFEGLVSSVAFISNDAIIAVVNYKVFYRIELGTNPATCFAVFESKTGRYIDTVFSNMMIILPAKPVAVIQEIGPPRPCIQYPPLTDFLAGMRLMEVCIFLLAIHLKIYIILTAVSRQAGQAGHQHRGRAGRADDGGDVGSRGEAAACTGHALNARGHTSNQVSTEVSAAVTDALLNYINTHQTMHSGVVVDFYRSHQKMISKSNGRSPLFVIVCRASCPL